MIITKVHDASILKVEDEKKYIFRHDGKNTELDAFEAYKFYSILDAALSSKSFNSQEDTLCVAAPGDMDIYFEIERKKALEMWVELRNEDETGRGYWCND